MSTPNARLAVLIDADNTSPKHASALLDELATYGVVTVKRAYGDWTTPQLGGWKTALNQHAIVPIQQFAYTTGKNSTDSMLIIDAMDLLYSGNLDAFALVSSDSDFTRLATRLRESGKTVYGLGLRKTPASLVAACDRFIYLEVLGREPAQPSPRSPSSEEPPLPDLESLLTRAVDHTSPDEGSVGLGSLSNYLRSQSASFDPRLYGFSKLSSLVQAQPYLTVSGSGGAIQVSLKSTAKAPPAKKAVRKAAAKTADKTTDKTADRTTEKTETAADKPAEKPAEKKAPRKRTAKKAAAPSTPPETATPASAASPSTAPASTAPATASQNTASQNTASKTRRAARSTQPSG